MWKNIKVVELASVLAGPLVGTFFAELGAEVLKVENKVTGGDVTRSWKLPSENTDNPISAYYASANFGKKTVMLNLKNENDYKQCMQLIAQADIVIQNFKPGDAKKLKLHAKYLRELYPSLIVAKLNGYGEESNRPAFDVVLQAETGFMYMNGNKDSGPVKMPVALIDILAAHHLKEAILIALIERYQTNVGKTISISLYDAAIASLANQASNYLMEGHIPQAMGTQHPNIAPYGDMYLSKDEKYFVLAIGNNKHFDALFGLLELDPILKPEFSTNENRLKNREKLNTLLTSSFSVLNMSEISSRLMEEKIPFGSVKNLQEVFKNVGAQKMILEEKQEGLLKRSVKTLLQ